MAPAGILRHVQDARLAGLLFFISNVRAIPAHFPPDQRIGVRPDGLGIGRDKNARPVAAHVVVVQVGLRNPIPEQHFGHVLRFDHVVLEGVPVVVVADVLVVQPGQVRPLVLSAQGFLIPVGDHDLAVGVERGHQQEDHVVQDALRFIVGPRKQVIGQFRRHLRPADLRGVKAHGLADHRLPFSDQSPGFLLSEPAGIADAGVHFAQPLQPAYVVR